MFICSYCNTHRSPNNSGKTRHEKHCKKNPNRVDNNTPWNKGLTGDPRSRHSEETKRKLSLSAKGVASTPEKEKERIEKIRKKAKVKNGGYRRGSGRGKSGWYEGFYCDSSYELAYVIYCLEHKINIKRNKQKRKYVWKNKIRYYIPDFIVENKLVEIKGYSSPQWQAKLQYNPDITVLYEKDLKDVFEYVVNKYGKDYIRLYGG